ncbi:MAG: hypothetical protein ACJAQ9_002801 [Ilumatobacter sp.]|jgi:hypothetical protein
MSERPYRLHTVVDIALRVFGVTLKGSLNIYNIIR